MIQSEKKSPILIFVLAGILFYFSCSSPSGQQEGGFTQVTTSFNDRNHFHGTFLGGSGNDKSRCIKVDTQGNVWITGKTESNNFPVLDKAFYSSFNGGADGFVTKFDSDLSKLMACTFIGGQQDDECYCLDFGKDGARLFDFSYD